MEKLHIRQAKQDLHKTIIDIICSYAKSNEDMNYLFQYVEELAKIEKERID